MPVLTIQGGIDAGKVIHECSVCMSPFSWAPSRIAEHYVHPMGLNERSIVFLPS